MKVTLPEFERAGVMVVGDVMLDRYWYGPTSRISPEAPVPVVKVDTIEERPGGAANVAMNIASLGAQSRLVGLTGIDDAARALSKSLADVNVKCDFVSVPTHPTITKLRVLSRNQQLIRLDFEEGFEGVDPEPLHERINQALDNIGALEAVDWVVSFEEDTPQRLIAGILPDLLVKGGDYKPEQIAGSEEVWANGGEVMVLNFEDGCSTTNIIKKIQKDSQ